MQHVNSSNRAYNNSKIVWLWLKMKIEKFKERYCRKLKQDFCGKKKNIVDFEQSRKQKHGSQFVQEMETAFLALNTDGFWIANNIGFEGTTQSYDFYWQLWSKFSRDIFTEDATIYCKIIVKNGDRHGYKSCGNDTCWMSEHLHLETGWFLHRNNVKKSGNTNEYHSHLCWTLFYRPFQKFTETACWKLSQSVVVVVNKTCLSNWRDELSWL